jgi:hypothetical protein
MSRYTRENRSSKAIRYDYAMKSAKDDRRADREVKPALAEMQAKQKANPARLTLDDFGGRSDALGG